MIRADDAARPQPLCGDSVAARFIDDNIRRDLAPNPLQRIPVAFGTVAPDTFLAPLAGDDDALVSLEGVSMYLSDEALTALALALGRHLPWATLVYDLMSPMFARATSHCSSTGRTAELGSLPIPSWVLATFLRGLRDGYQIWTFEKSRA